MKKSEIRPASTYIGHGGLMRKVKSISMNISGGLSVEWKSVGPRGPNGTISASESIDSFAKWALSITDTLSDDLKHYLTK
ncbi:hypothetical protein KDX23_22835 [Burkholderia vietnamiensis]|uniref:hypothetical protein n=1 Tax=Burkholderia vietnamiensis TaxID=60552 RepID=UPI001B955CF8|nr:hypothetical protein [Burkholderia vietnamiensis]MBR8085575.1 hypothetical protein [Burkholderia vietnamiensis]